MTISELPIEIQQQIAAERIELGKKCINDGYTVEIYNSDGTRYFYARRYQYASQYMAFGGGSYWKIQYGVVGWFRRKNPVGEWDYELGFGKCFGKSANGTIIPKQVSTKKEVIAIAKAIGIFNI